ncbi:MAG: type III polyketide synthase, partial [Rhodothermales bacterium]
MRTVLRAIATGNPQMRGSQREAAEFMERVTTIPEQIRKRIPAIYERSGIEYRYSCIDDWVREVEDFDFFPPNAALQPAPTTARRNQIYREAVIPLATDVSRRVLEEANVEPSSITHVVAVSCTGFFAPGLDIELVKRLGLPADTRRTFIGFMGCYAAFNALRVADGFCRSHPGATVLVVCAELCTLHFQVNGSLESAVVNAIFSDGAAAAVLQGVPDDDTEGDLV